MRTTKPVRMSAIALFIAVLAAQNALAYYNPSTGRFLSRDPIGEPGFQLVQGAQGAPVVGSVQVAQQPSRWISRDPIKEAGTKLIFTAKSKRVEDSNDYLFVRNNPLSFCDPFGLSVADVANMYSAFVDELKQLCACHLSCPEIGWRQNIPPYTYWGCTRQTENLEDVFDKLHYEDGWDITVNYDTSSWPLNHNSVRVKPRNPEDPVVDADTWRGCFSVTWPQGSSQKDFKQCFTCKELLKK